MPTLFVGIDVSKQSHVAGFLSRQLLRQKQEVARCPTHSFPHTRAGIDALREHIRAYGGEPDSTAILMELTGHYHRSLLEVLQAEGYDVYVIAIHTKKVNGQQKSDKLDALRLANLLYAQVGLGAHMEDPDSRVERRLPPVPTAAMLQPLVQRRTEIVRQTTRLKNKLTALCDEIFPELTTVFHNPNLDIALDFRERFSTPRAVAEATLADLRIIRRKCQPVDAKLVRLQELAQTSIGVTNEARLHGLVREQHQLIREFRLQTELLAEIDQEIGELIEASREGQILLSIPSIGPLTAAILLAGIGNIRNFPRASKLRGYVGWAPRGSQTGTTLDVRVLQKTGTRLLKPVMFMLAMNATNHPAWHQWYQELVEKTCAYDARKQVYRGRKKAIGRLAGQITGLIYTLLSKDADVLDHLPDGQEPPPPVLYDQALHERDRHDTRPHDRPAHTA